MPYLLTKLSLDDIPSRIRKYPVILFSPRSRHRNVFMAAFLATSDTYLYTLSPTETTLSAFALGLVAALQKFFPDFGSQTVQALTAGPVDLAKALIADLKHLKTARMLILDEVDRLHPDANTAAFFKHFLTKLPHGMQVVVNSRVLPDRPWGELVREDLALALGEEIEPGGNILSNTTDTRPCLEVYGFGTGHVYVDGLPVETWDGPLPRNLFFYFVDHPMITRDEIFETFWPGMKMKEATNVFHVTKRKVSERIGYELTTYKGGFYRLSDEVQLHYDVANFEKAAPASDDGSDVMQPLCQAVQIYHHEFLHTNTMPWISQRREQLRLSYAAALISLARFYTGQENDALAVSYYLRALREVPQREDIHRDVMTIYGQQGEQWKISAQYKALQDTLKHSLGIAPAAHAPFTAS